jgi:purine-binding chemotaxis protein CheW
MANLRVVVFQVAGHEYVVDVTLVQEIVRLADLSTGREARLVHVDGAPEYVKGVIKLRGRIVPVVDMRKHLGVKGCPATADTCAIVAKLSIGPVGFIVDAVSELMWVKRHDFQAPLPLIAGIDRNTFPQICLQGMAHLGDRLLVMLDLERMLTPGEHGGSLSVGAGLRTRPSPGELFSGQVEVEAQEAGQASARSDLRGLVVFELGGESYGVPITDVAQVREPLPIMPLPNVPSYVLGLINLRGVILPVLDLRQKFGLALEPDGPGTRLVVLKALRQAQDKSLHADRRQNEGSRGCPVALRVDRVHGLARLPQVDFQPAPPGVARIDPEYYDQVAVLDGRLLIELDIQALAHDKPIQKEP